MKRLIVTLSAAWLFLAIGCSDSPTNNTVATQTPDLNDEFGGYLPTNEEVAFGDAELASEAASDEEFDDPILLSPGVDSLIADTTGSYYHLRMVWGKLRLDTSVTAVTDWTGSLTISSGAIVIRRTIHFELGQDYIPTRTDPALLEWVSYTTIHNDGLAVDLYVPYDSAVAPTPVTVDFATGPYSRSFTINELAALDTIVYLADSNAVLFQAFELNRYRCARGFLTGTWGYDDQGNGIFRGLWTDRCGLVVGYVNGHFGIDDQGQKVFFGKWVSLDGRFEGFLRGKWDYQPSPYANPNARRHAGGWFAGEVLNADGTPIGVVRGKYRSHPQFKNGFLGGRWKVHCDVNDPELDDSEEGF
jgi:hypothetical protein